MSKGKIYLIPNLLGEGEVNQVIPTYVQELINQIDYYIVENEKNARRYLRKLQIQKPIDELTLFHIDKHNKFLDINEFISPCFDGDNVGVISDAGCPGIADPGAEIVSLAHRKGIEVVPLVGPSSIFMALMASGFSGQNFCFSGYLPINEKDRTKAILEIEKNAMKNAQTQIFMETPYRNMRLLEDLINTCKPDTKVCVACDISLPTQYIKTQTLKDWRKTQQNFDKRPCVFLMF